MLRRERGNDISQAGAANSVEHLPSPLAGWRDCEFRAVTVDGRAPIQEKRELTVCTMRLPEEQRIDDRATGSNRSWRLILRGRRVFRVGPFFCAVSRWCRHVG